MNRGSRAEAEDFHVTPAFVNGGFLFSTNLLRTPLCIYILVKSSIDDSLLTTNVGFFYVHHLIDMAACSWWRQCARHTLSMA